MRKQSAEEVLEYLTLLMTAYLEELQDVTAKDELFAYGERTAYTECLEVIQNWEKAENVGLNFDIERRYPL